jgi:hypothetical protein
MQSVTSRCLTQRPSVWSLSEKSLALFMMGLCSQDEPDEISITVEERTQHFATRAEYERSTQRAF